MADAVDDWLKYGLTDRSEKTRENRRLLAEGHIIPQLGARKLRDLTAEEVDEWLELESKLLATSTLQRVRAILASAIKRAQKRGKVKRNVVFLCECPSGKRAGRKSKALTLIQAEALLNAALESQSATIRAYIVVSVLTGARTEEMRALRWEHVHLAGDLTAKSPVLPYVELWRSVRVGGDTKTHSSRRTLAIPQRCVDVLRHVEAAQVKARNRAGERWKETDLVFATRYGTELDAGNVRRAFRSVAKAAGLVPEDWTPRDLRHSFVSLLSDAKMPIEEIARLVGHKGGSKVTELIYRHQLRPVLEEGATAMDRIFSGYPPADGQIPEGADSVR
ncbi:tyrosine-type recombinase/integrase [Amycolatopsis sulphurea]|uniref:tyrosine-type recombinase/integrase n=1 Tax=Amycolatopsis sulphurea TaxID=76022 RepID=UPI001FECE1F8|nr:site-specific integrase [Amycolatopsis sulphurea]